MKLRPATTTLFQSYNFQDQAGNPLPWALGQLEIADAILNRSSPDSKKRVQVIASTQYGKSIAVAAAVVIRASVLPETWAIVAGTKEKARIIMDYIIQFSLSNPLLRSQLLASESLDRLRMKRSQDRISYQRGGEVRVYSADAGKIAEVSKSLMGFGAQNVIADESALIPDLLQATIMRMLGGHKDNFLMKVGNPFNRNHFLRTWKSPKYHHVFIDYKRALSEGRYTEEFIEEMKEEALFDILYGCQFPDEGMIDRAGWTPLLTDGDVERATVGEDEPIFGEIRLGVDVAGGGSNYSVIVLRGYNTARIMYKKNEPDTMLFANKVLELQKARKIADGMIFVDTVGIGKGLYDRLRHREKGVTHNGYRAVSGGAKAKNERFVNLRAENYWRLREWIYQGGKIVAHDDWSEITQVKWKVDFNDRIKIMSKEEMLKNGIDSPDVADALAMTFTTVEEKMTDAIGLRLSPHESKVNPDPFD